MAGKLLSFGIQKLWDRLSQECALFHGVDDQVAELKSDLNLLNSFLKDADAKKHTSAMVRNCVLEIKEIICDSEDIIETFLLKEKFGKTSGVKKHIRRLACVIPDRREIALDIGGLSKRISKMISVMQCFEIKPIIADSGYRQPLHDRQRQMRQEFARENESDLVGLEANVERLVKYLVEEDNVQVVSMTGMGGLGKTTLARQAFNHEMVEKKFDRLAWVCVTQVCDRMNVWQTILQNFKPKEKQKKIMDMDERTLHGELFGLLKTSKSLIVFDDIWEEEDWVLIKSIFPPEKGWKVLLTSRNENVARRGDTAFINFKPDCLTNEESWTLFQRIAMPREAASELEVEMEKSEERIEMEKMGKQMIEHCKGFPLAIRVLGGLLVAKYTLRDWKRVSENIGSHLVGRNDFNDHNNNSLYNVLSLSFEELPSYLKYCFLYLAHFPEDYEIDVESLSYYWAAEEILRFNDGETIRDAGETYIEELVRRNMVISKRDVKTERFETCQLHDLMREICLSKAKEENFVQLVGIHSHTAHSQSLSTSRRFVSQNATTLHVEREINNSKVRSLVVVKEDLFAKWELSGLSFSSLQLLRVLHLPAAEFKGWLRLSIGKLPYSIGKLIYLKYLSLENALVRHLPSSLRNLKLLIYLNLDVSEDIFVPNVLMEMKELRYLALPRRMKKTKLELSNLKKLETLKNFSTQNCSLEDLCGMARMRTLGIKLIGETSLEKLSASIGGMRHLENLRINGDEFAMKKIEKGFVLDAVDLRQLDLFGIYMPKFPDERHFPSHLTTIFLQNCRLEEDPMPILGKLLQLKEVSLWEGSFCGTKMDCSIDWFPQLQELDLWALKELEEWIVEEGSMPLLHTLIISDCPQLKELPDGLRFIPSLKDLTCLNMGEEWKGRLSEGGEDYYKVQHIPSVTFKEF